MTAAPPPILLVKRGDIRQRDLNLARKAGILVIESNDPSSVRFVDAPIAKGNLARVADSLVRELLTNKRNAIYDSHVRERLAATIMADEQPLAPALPEGAKK
jgi:hypothetical protein